MSDLIFVYGTLRPALAAGEMRKLISSLERIGTATMPGRLYELGRYPVAVLHAPGGSLIVGEVFRLSNNPTKLAKLDDHEEFLTDDPKGSLYLRVQSAATLEDGRSLPVWVYEYNRSVEGRQLVPGGDYVAWRSR